MRVIHAIDLHKKIISSSILKYLKIVFDCLLRYGESVIGGQQVEKEGTKGEKGEKRGNEKKKCNYSGGNDNEVYILITRGRAARWSPPMRY